MENNVIRGYYFSQVDDSGVGPRKKIINQINAFAKNGIELELIESPFKLDGPIRGKFVLRQLVSRIPFTYVYSKHKYFDKYSDADVYYVRFLAGDIHFSHFIKKLKKNNPESKIVMELADYPTTWYMTTNLLYRIVYFPIILKDILARRYYKKYVDRIALLKPISSVYGIPTIQFFNGIDVNSVAVKKRCGLDKIRIIAVAAMCNFHGYERLIEGLGNYYRNGGTRKIEIHFVGGKMAPGNELSKYKEISDAYKLTNTRIFFYGERVGQELDIVYDQCNLAVASLGMYKIGYTVANSLKIREYLAKGLPIISGCKIDAFELGDFQYGLEFSNDEAPIDIEKVVLFFDEIYKVGETEVIDRIRAYAEKYCDMEYAMKPVIDYFKE